MINKALPIVYKIEITASASIDTSTKVIWICEQQSNLSYLVGNLALVDQILGWTSWALLYFFIMITSRYDILSTSYIPYKTWRGLNCLLHCQAALYMIPKVTMIFMLFCSRLQVKHRQTGHHCSDNGWLSVLGKTSIWTNGELLYITP